ncbi:MAG: CCA tRNA nucleotidyltransferase [Xenococcaceae cyanobacterium MO_167.B52]|nr:CCA tRNA nucleotidyltransferase [Xenococcaceae cyanobacterium MO_167.B52]
MNLKTTNLSLTIPALPFDVEFLPPHTCLVGGVVRDAFLGRKGSYLDLDFVVPENSIETAKRIAYHYNGGFVILDQAREIARVVFPQATLDFALQEGDCLETDLKRRDFTINAIAYDVREQKVIDPLGGIKDLAQKSIRMISAENLKDDPLRLLRGYRQAAQLNFTIEPETRKTIQSLASLLGKMAAERVQTELNYLLVCSLGNTWLKSAWEDGLITLWFNHVDRNTITELETVEETGHFLTVNYPGFGDRCHQWLALAKLATLVASDIPTAQLELERLKYSRSHIRNVLGTIKILNQLATLTDQRSPASPRCSKGGTGDLMSLREQYFFFLEVKKIFPIIAVKAIAKGMSKSIIIPLVKRYLNPDDPVAHPKPLVTGNDLIRELDLKPSPIIGTLLTEINIAYIEGKVTNVNEAIEFASKLF